MNSLIVWKLFPIRVCPSTGPLRLLVEYYMKNFGFLESNLLFYINDARRKVSTFQPIFPICIPQKKLHIFLFVQ